MVNVNELKGKIRSAGLTQKSLAEEIGMGENSFSNKLNGKNGACFDVVEAEKICEVLNITKGSEKANIFLS